MSASLALRCWERKDAGRRGKWGVMAAGVDGQNNDVAMQQTLLTAKEPVFLVMLNCFAQSC